MSLGRVKIVRFSFLYTELDTRFHVRSIIYTRLSIVLMYSIARPPRRASGLGARVRAKYTMNRN